MNTILFPKLLREFEITGENIKLARLRRKLSPELVCERTGLTDKELFDIESGCPDISIGSYILVLRCYGLEQDIFKITTDDVLGRKLQDLELLNK